MIFNSTKFNSKFESILSFSEETILFQCRYARTVNTDSNFEVPPFESQPVIGNGTLSYDIESAVGNLGGTTLITISPNHSFGDQITPRLVKIFESFS